MERHVSGCRKDAGDVDEGSGRDAKLARHSNDRSTLNSLIQIFEL
jgi:hypothetical protein